MLLRLYLLHMKAKIEAYFYKKKAKQTNNFLCSKQYGYCYTGGKRKNQIKPNAREESLILWVKCPYSAFIKISNWLTKTDNTKEKKFWGSLLFKIILASMKKSKLYGCSQLLALSEQYSGGFQLSTVKRSGELVISAFRWLGAVYKQTGVCRTCNVLLLVFIVIVLYHCASIAPFHVMLYHVLYLHFLWQGQTLRDEM